LKNFIQDAFNELSHVVWPTKTETRTFFKIVSWSLLISIIILFIVRYGLGEWVFYARGAIQGEVENASLDGSPINTTTVTDSEGNPIEGIEITTDQNGEVNITRDGEAIDATGLVPEGEANDDAIPNTEESDIESTEAVTEEVESTLEAPVDDWVISEPTTDEPESSDA